MTKKEQWGDGVKGGIQECNNGGCEATVSQERQRKERRLEGVVVEKFQDL